MTVYQVYGLTIDSPRPIFGDAPETEQDADYRLVVSDEEVPAHEARGDDILLTYQYDDAYYFAERLDDGRIVFVFVGACEFALSPDTGLVVVTRHAGADPGIEDVLGSGALPAFLLYLRGVLVLHASAVEIDGRIVAFTGGSGRGKSTMATLMCAAGAAILTDDLLRVDFDGDGGVRAGKGSADLRLRKGADTLAADFAGTAPERGSTADDRQIVRPAVRARDAQRLAAIFLPIPDRASSDVRIERLHSSQALFVLLNSPRIFGWLDPEVRTTQFRHLGRLVERVPFYFVHVPWGPPFAPGIAQAIAAELDLGRAPTDVSFTAP